MFSKFKISQGILKTTVCVISFFVLNYSFFRPFSTSKTPLVTTRMLFQNKAPSLRYSDFLIHDHVNNMHDHFWGSLGLIFLIYSSLDDSSRGESPVCL